MSTKTLRKRIALAAVTALSAGLLTATTAHAASTLSVGAQATDGISYSTTIGSEASTGLLASSGTGLAQTATLLSTGVLVVAASTPSTGYANGILVTGGTIKSATAESTAGNIKVNSGLTFVSNTATDKKLSVAISPSSGSTSLTVQLYDGLAASATSSSGGTLVGQLTVTVAASSTAGTVSAANSGVYYSFAGGNGTAATKDDTTTTIATNYYDGVTPWNQIQQAQVVLKDAYKNPVTGGSTHLVTATATNGALVSVSASGTTTPTTAGSAFSNSSSAAGTWDIAVKAPSAAPLSTTVTVAYDGVTVGTKTFTFTGPVTKIVLGTPGLINQTGKNTVTRKGASVKLYDSAGNAIQAIASDAIYDASTSKFAAVSTNPVTSGLSFSSASTSTATYVDWTCQAGIAAHTDAVALKYTNIEGTVATSNTINVSCAGAPDTYTAKYDKASYNAGDVATLTVQFLDSKGNKAADVDNTGAKIYNFSDYATTNPIITVAGGSLAAAVTSVDTTSLGAAAYTVLVGSTSGTFQTVVNVTTSPSGSAVTVPLVVGSTGTSLNDVLKGIVELIASINKQIAALAKLVTKKK